MGSPCLFPPVTGQVCVTQIESCPNDGICDHGGLNENVPLRLSCLNAWSLVDDIVWKGLEGVALLKVICHGGGGKL